MMNFTRRVLEGPTSILALLMVSLLAVGLVGCSSDTDPGAPAGSNQTATGVFHVDLEDSPPEFEILSAKNGDPADPILGPMAICGRNIHYDTDAGALVLDLSVKNVGEETYDEPVMLTFLALLPDGVTVVNADNGETGAGATFEFQFENDDAMWAPGEESLPREVRFGVAQGEAVGFVARLDAGDMDGDLGSIGGMVWNDENGDGIMDDTEAGVEGATLMLSAEGMDPVETMTAADGTYTFGDLDSGFYTVTRKPMDGMVGTTSDMIYVVLVTDAGTVVSFLAANFGVMADDGGDPMGIVKGKVWNDLNGDGKLNDGEPGVEGIPVILSGDAADTTMTMADGTYAFEGLAAGTYELVSVGPEGWSLTTPSSIQAVLPENDSVFNEGNFGWMEDEVMPTGSIGGVVFNDLNGNKVRDDGEPGVEGIPVVLAWSDITKDLPDTTTTDADGMYGFDELGAGDYVVTSLGPDGWLYTTGPLNVKLDTDDQVVDDADHGWMEESTGPTGYIKGTVWNDLNGDGMIDDGEPGVEGILVDLSGDATGSTTTGADGVFTFDMLGAGSYEVVSNGPAGWSLTTPSPVSVTLDTDDAFVNDVVFGWMEDAAGPTGSIAGVVFNDLNGNKIRDDGEAGVEGIEVNLTGDGTGTTITDADGMYAFDALGAGTYTVTSVGPIDWIYTTGPLTVKLDTDDTMVTDADHGWMEETTGPMGMIKGKVWNDLNGDGKLNDGEPGVEGIVVDLSGDATGSTTTAADGTFLFEMLAAGAYEVVSNGPAGWSLTTPSPVAVTLDTDDAVVNDVVFGWMEDAVGPTGEISGVVFNDLNGNKVRDDGEPGIEGIDIILSGDGSGTVTSDADGMYAFENLGAGNYIVTSLGPAGWTNTTGLLTLKLDMDDSVIDNADHGWQELP